MLQKYGLAWWALQLPVVRVVVGSFSFRLFEQQVNFDKANCVVHYIQRMICHFLLAKSLVRGLNKFLDLVPLC